VIEVLGYLTLGLVAGSLAATLGIGGGVIYVPALVTFFAFTQHTAQGTSLAIIVPTTIVAAVGHARARRILPRLAVALGAAGILGAIAGARVALIADEQVLRRMFAVVLVVVAVRMALRTRQLYRSRTLDGGTDPSGA